jgi:hypothetical protein
VLPQLLERLGDSFWGVRMSSVAVMERWRVPEAAPQLREALADPEGFVRVAAASALCSLGFREGAPMLLEEREALTRLNGLRAPDAWKRLSGKTVAGRVEGTAKEILERWAKEIGLTLDAGEAPSEERVAWLSERRVIQEEGSPMSLVEAIEKLLDESYELVFEADRVRLLTRDKALAFWKGWWAEDSSKK